MPAKRLRLFVLPDVERDFIDIYEPVYTRILDRLHLLRQFPELGPVMNPPFHRWRSTVVNMFRIIYRVAPRGIEVASVRHCKRKLPKPL